MSSPRIEYLRNLLLRRGMSTSRPPPPPNELRAELKPEQLELARRVRPFAEAMYLVIGADAEIGERERDVLRGALRTLTDNTVRSAVLDTMLGEFERARAEEGTDARLDAIASVLYSDPLDAHLALELAVAAAEVDGRFDAHEQAMVRALAERLGIGGERLDALLEHDPHHSAGE